jgi:[acyl-carrier-protein] S-malonyltransferase
VGVSLAGPIGLLFPGQGVQKPGMSRKIHDRYPAAQAAFERAERVLGMPVRRLCFEGPGEELNRTDVLQPCVMTCSWAAYEVWRESHGMEKVKVMAGHSLGEFTALAAAGAMTWEAALVLVKERGEIMSRAAQERPGAMIAIVDLDHAQIEAILAEASKIGKLYLANRNANVQFVLSGEVPAVQEAERLALAAGARRALILTIPLAAHSPLMAKAGAEFKKVVDQIDISVPAVPILANATGNPIRTVDALRNELTNHLLRPVDWMRTMLSLQRMQVKTVVELGPGRVLASLAAKHIPGIDTWNAEELFIDYVDTPREVPA